jgi:hypothetical protein
MNRHRPHDLQVPPGICNTPLLGTSSSTMQQPLNVPNPTPIMGVASNKPTRDGEGIMQGLVDPTEGTLQFISPSRLYGRPNWTHPYQPGTASAPTHFAGMKFATHSSIPTMPYGSILPFAATVLPSTAKGSDHGITRSSPQPGPTQELGPCAEYVAPSKGSMLGGVEVTIVGTNFPHTLPLSVYFSTKLALIVSWEYLARDQPINAERLSDSKDSGDHTMFGSRRIISWNCRCADCGGTPRISTRG